MGYNTFIIWLLRSPFHGLMGAQTAVITLTGRRSGRTLRLPVNCVKTREGYLITSRRDCTWWRNLRGGAPVSVHLQGRELPGRAEVIVDEPRVAAGLQVYLEQVPQNARYFGVGLDNAGKPLASDCARAAGERVIVRFTPLA